MSITRRDTTSCKHVIRLSKRLHGDRLRRLLKSKAGERCITGESTMTRHEHAVKIGGRLHPAVLHAHAISAPATGGVAPATARHIKPAVKPAVEEVASTSTPTVSNEFAVDPFTTSILARYLSLGVNVDKPPAALVPIYKSAGKRYRVPWQILAAINAIETDYGHDLAVSPKGAVGWMQFMPGTWSEYGVSVMGPEYGVSVTGPRYGVAFTGLYADVSVTGPEYFVTGATAPNPYDPRDAIFSAARYLKANGAPRHLRRALFAYNHAVWYVDEVVWTAEAIIDHGLRPHTRARARIADMRAMAEILNGEPYVYGGGHGGWGVGYGYDCSGFVSAVLHAGGYLSGPQDTQTLPFQRGILNGPGKWVTIFDRTDGGSLPADHVIIDIKGQWWESGGGGPAGAPSVHRMRHVSVAYLAEFNRVLHPRGL